MVSEFDRQLIAATRSGLPLVARPYDAIAQRLGVDADRVRTRLQSMLHEGVIRRIGAVPDHYRLGYTTSGMTVWDVDDAHVDTLGEKVGALAFVSHCYLRPRALPDWPYNLFAMVHGHGKVEVERLAFQIHCLLADACVNRDILYGSRVLKSTPWRWADIPTSG